MKLFSKLGCYLGRAGEIVQYRTKCYSENVVSSHSKTQSQPRYTDHLQYFRDRSLHALTHKLMNIAPVTSCIESFSGDASCNLRNLFNISVCEVASFSLFSTSLTEY